MLDDNQWLNNYWWLNDDGSLNLNDWSPNYGSLKDWRA
jgi:hypothetical protein